MYYRLQDIAPALVAACQDETRFGIAGVRFDTRGGRIMGTNGHVLVLVPMDSPYPDLDPFTLERQSASGLCKAIRGLPKVLREQGAELDTAETSANGHARFRVPGAILDGPKLEADYPDVDQVIPAFHEGSIDVGLGVDALESVVKACKARGTRFLKLSLDSREKERKGSPMLWEAKGGGGDIRIVTMPARVD